MTWNHLVFEGGATQEAQEQGNCAEQSFREGLQVGKGWAGSVHTES